MLAADLAVDLGVVLAVCGLGALAVRAVLPRASGLELLALGFPVGGGLLTLAGFLASWAGVQLNLATVAVIWLLLCLAALSMKRLTGGAGEVGVSDENRPGSPRRGLWSPQELPVRLALVAFLLLVAALAATAIGRSHSNYDAAAMWIIKGYGIAKEGSIFGALQWGAHGLAYPLNIQLMVMLFRLTSADRVPSSQLIFLLFYCSTVLMVLAYWQRRQVATLHRALGLLLIASVPIMVLHSTVAFPNLPMAFYVVSASVYGMEGLFLRSPRPLLLGGILLGMASWTTIEGFQYAAITLIVLMLSAAWDVRLQLRDCLCLSVPFLLITGVWLVFYQRYGASGSQAIGTLNTMLTGLRAGDYNLVELRLIFGYLRRYLFDTGTWGLLFSVGGVVLVMGAVRLRDELVPEAFTTVLLFLGTGALTCALFYLRSFVTSDFWAWLLRGFPRGFLPSAIFFAMTVIRIAPTVAVPLHPGTRQPREVT
jgi:hypothetical protein